MLIPEFYLLLAKVIIVSLSFLLMIGVRTLLMLLIFILSLIWLPHPEFMVLVLGFCGFLLLNFSGTITSLRFITYSLYSNFDNNELLQLIQILMLPNDEMVDFDLVEYKDKDLVELFCNLYQEFCIDVDFIGDGMGKIVKWINFNRTQNGKRKFNLNKINDEKLKILIQNGIGDCY